MKKSSKISSFVLATVLMLMPAIAFAAKPNLSGVSGDDILSGQESFIATGINILQWIGYAVAVVMILWLGIQWMLAQPAKKAELKGKMWSMAIGILLLVGGVTIIDIAWDAFSNGF